MLNLTLGLFILLLCIMLAPGQDLLYDFSLAFLLQKLHALYSSNTRFCLTSFSVCSIILSVYPFSLSSLSISSKTLFHQSILPLTIHCSTLFSTNLGEHRRGAKRGRSQSWVLVLLHGKRRLEIPQEWVFQSQQSQRESTQKTSIIPSRNDLR